MNILCYISRDRENPSTRKDLMFLTGLSDRKVRECIEELRRDGCIIINKQDGKGYYISNDIEDIKCQYHQNNSRALSILVQQKFLRRRLGLVGQIEMKAGV